MDQKYMSNQENNMKKKTDKLIMRTTMSFVTAIGYGLLFKCQIVKIISGKIDEKEITVTILAGDKANLNFISTHNNSVEFEIGFKKIETNVLYSWIPKSGFIDRDRTYWEIEYLGDIPYPDKSELKS
jgi:hypothetical protein